LVIIIKYFIKIHN